ncbi:DUF1127 domain-containing protein [Phaeobacter sp. J2-8]|uniref:DUF1127 domain-containing protein n=1 Tax=Phaeobacter sp. J2-8 TaxID=2931394 RepID=UPI001FD57EF1|nr:DUF1127 domain-containing protein [Phaeobacter sp. J2-8]MCJ7871582.1 DUF1127 domain-containing protein [Phaeobacter sp. J2-8]
MQIQTTQSAKASTTSAARFPGIARLFKLALDRVIAADRAFHERQNIRRLSDHLLNDVGMTRQQADNGGR